MELPTPKVGFEIEGYIILDGKLFELTEDQFQEFADIGFETFERKFEPYGYRRIEAKTFIPSEDPEKAAKDVLENLREGTDVLRKVTGIPDLRVVCESALFDAYDMKTDQDIGTHVHVDYKVFEEIAGIGFSSPYLVQTLMRRDTLKFIEQFCYSERIERLLNDPQSDINSVVFPGFLSCAKATVNYRDGGLNTMEIATPDSYDDLYSLVEMGRLAQRSAMDAVKDVLEMEDRSLPGEEKSREKMRELLADYIREDAA